MSCVTGESMGPLSLTLPFLREYYILSRNSAPVCRSRRMRGAAVAPALQSMIDKQSHNKGG